MNNLPNQPCNPRPTLTPNGSSPLLNSNKGKLSLDEAITERDAKLNNVPCLTNRDAAKAAIKPKRRNRQFQDNVSRAVILNFSRHPIPVDCIDTLSLHYQNIRLFTPIDDKGLYIIDNENNTKYNPLVTNPIERSTKTKSEQIHNWLYEYLTTRRDNGIYPLDAVGDYYIVLPHKDAQISLEILTALTGIKNIDWFIIWSTYNESQAAFTISEIVSTKGVYDSWKKIATDVSDISTRRKQKLLAQYSETPNKSTFLTSLSDEDYSLISYTLNKSKS